MVIVGDVRKELQHLEMGSVRTCVTSPPYFGLRDYGHDGQIGLEQTLEEYVEQMVKVFRLVRDVLTDDGTLWLNLGDSYNGSGGAGGDYNKGGLKEGQPKYPGRNLDCLKSKDLIGIPWRVAFALQADGWYLRSDIIWHKPNPMPESVTDRPTKSHEYLFLLTKNAKYYYDHEAIKEQSVMTSAGSAQRDTRNKRDVWIINTKPFKGAHFAVMPEALVEPCILAGSASGDTVLDPFAGSGTVGVVAKRHGRKFVGVELNPEYAEMAEQRINNEPERML
jgi:site-specific DNA-methyltransferase (cytosine-N4-specific)